MKRQTRLVYPPQHCAVRGAPGDPAGTERAYFSAKTVQIITDCFFNAPLWYLWGRGAVSSVSPATAIGVMGFCC